MVSDDIFQHLESLFSLFTTFIFSLAASQLGLLCLCKTSLSSLKNNIFILYLRRKWWNFLMRCNKYIQLSRSTQMTRLEAQESSCWWLTTESWVPVVRLQVWIEQKESEPSLPKVTERLIIILFTRIEWMTSFDYDPRSSLQGLLKDLTGYCHSVTNWELMRNIYLLS